MPPNRFAALRDDAGSPMSSMLPTTGPNLDISMEIAKPEEGWMDMQTWISPQDHQSLEDRRAGFDQFESTLIKAENDLGFDKGMAAMRPADVLRSTAYIAEDSTSQIHVDPIPSHLKSTSHNSRRVLAGAQTQSSFRPLSAFSDSNSRHLEEETREAPMVETPHNEFRRPEVSPLTSAQDHGHGSDTLSASSETSRTESKRGGLQSYVWNFSQRGTPLSSLL